MRKEASQPASAVAGVAGARVAATTRGGRRKWRGRGTGARRCGTATTGSAVRGDDGQRRDGGATMRDGDDAGWRRGVVPGEVEAGEDESVL